MYHASIFFKYTLTTIVIGGQSLATNAVMGMRWIELWGLFLKRNMQKGSATNGIGYQPLLLTALAAVPIFFYSYFYS
jgi:hypothetical protein